MFLLWVRSDEYDMYVLISEITHIEISYECDGFYVMRCDYLASVK